MRMCEVVQLKLIRLRHFAVTGLWITMGMSRFCLHNGLAAKFCLQNGLATKFFLQSGGRVMHPLCVLYAPPVYIKKWGAPPQCLQNVSGNR